MASKNEILSALRQLRIHSPNWIDKIIAHVQLSQHLDRSFEIGDTVTKIRGSSWTGTVCGFYSTKLTPLGYCVESNKEKGSVQIYPEAALRLVRKKKNAKRG